MLSRLTRRVRTRIEALPPVTGIDVLTVACWCGLMFGFIEGVNAVIRRRIAHMPTGEYTWTELLWMPPLVAAFTLVIVALLLIAIDRIVRARGALLRVGPWLLLALAMYGCIRSLYPGIASVAGLLLAMGAAVALSRLVAPRLPRIRRAARWQMPVALGAFTLWAIGVPRFREYQERRARAALPAAAADAPNVLLIIWDTARALSLSLYGHERRTTPNLEEYARGGTVFENAFATSSWSLPSHASMYTGRDAHEIHINRDVPMDDTYPTLGEVLSRHGYVTAGFTGNLFYGSRDFGIARGFAWYDDEARTTPSKLASTWSLTRRILSRWRHRQGNRQEIVRRTGDHVTEKVLQWIDRRGSRPFFASINYFDAHEPYQAPAPYDTAFGTVRPRYWEGDERPTEPNVLKELNTAYEQSILYVDAETRRLLDAMQTRGALDNTLVIIVADHGDQFGDHGAHLFGHERSLYNSVLHVPLVLVYPKRVPAGARRPEVVSIRDIPATVVEALGLPERDVLPGISLLRYTSGTATEAEVATPRLAHLQPNKFYPAEMDWANREQHRFAVTSGTLRYLINASGTEELYDFVSDPWETRNLIKDSTQLASLRRFRAVLDSVVPDSLRVAPDTSAH